MTRRQTLLAILEAAGDRGATTAELIQGGVGSRYSARLLELRDEGYVIQGERVRDGSWRYTLTDSPQELDGPPNPLGPVEGGGPGALGVSGAGTPALFEMPAPSRAHWEGEAA